MQAQRPESALDKLWRKRAEYDARSATHAGNQISEIAQPLPLSPAGAASAEAQGNGGGGPGLNQLPVPKQPKQGPGLQIDLPFQQEQAQPRVPTPKAAQSRPLSGTVGLAKRLSSAVSSAAKAAAAGPQDGPSIAVAAFQYKGSTQREVSGISLMGGQLASAERRISRSSVLNRNRTQGMSAVMAENTALLIQAVARNDSDTVNSMLKQGAGSMDDTDSRGNSTPPPPPRPFCLPNTVPNTSPPPAPQPCATLPA